MCLVGSSNRHRAGFERVKTDGLSCNTLAVSLAQDQHNSTMALKPLCLVVQLSKFFLDFGYLILLLSPLLAKD